jgi:hypothetical protein
MRKIVDPTKVSNTGTSLKFLTPNYTTLGLYELSYNEANIRKLGKDGFARLKKKILENVYEPLKVWKKGNVVLSGNQRLSVMRHLVENDGYEIDKVHVAIYDVDERTAKFIELADNEHDGKYDLEKLMEEFENIDGLDLTDILDPKLIKKIGSKMGSLDDDDLDLDDDDKLDIIESTTTDIIITGVPKKDSILFYDTVDSIGKKVGIRNQWAVLKLMLNAMNDMDVDELMKYC